MTRTVFTTITPLPAGISRETVMQTLHSRDEMIMLNPLVEGFNPIKPPPEATPEEYHCKWYEITDKISYLPGVKGSVSFKSCFHDLPQGLQVHVYAPMGLDIQEKWSLGGSLPHEPVQPVEIGLGVPITGLYLREDVEMKCNFMMTKFVKKQLKDALAALVARLVIKSQLVEAVHQNRRLTYNPSGQFTPPTSPPMSPRQPFHQTYEQPMSPPPTGGLGMKMDYPAGRSERPSSLGPGSGSQRNSQYSGHQHSPQPQFANPMQSPGLQGQGQSSPKPNWQTQNYHSQLATQKMVPEPLGHPATVMELDSTQTYKGPQQGYTAELP